MLGPENLLDRTTNGLSNVYKFYYSSFMHENGLPAGILPAEDVMHFRVHEDGSFHVQLKRSQEKNIHGHVVRYLSEVSGVVEKGRMSSLKGVKVRRLLLGWSRVDTIRRIPHSISFQFGRISKTIPESAFQ